MKKILIAWLVIVLLLSGCSGENNKKNESNIQYTEGQFYDTSPPIMEGAVTDFDDETITLRIKGEDYTVILSDRAKEEIQIFKDKHNKIIKVGTLLQIKYEMLGEKYVANNILFLKRNLQSS
ncbi:MAG: hypothetical protein E7404_09180 [Ruminococcaceae bacterium]|nr:hypothetical protein [Oscillospiraceae bacterium]